MDTTTLITTIKELKAMEVNTKFAILDAGYVTEKGLRQLYDDNISFITRCPTNRTIYKRLMANELTDLEKARIWLLIKKACFSTADKCM